MFLKDKPQPVLTVAALVFQPLPTRTQQEIKRILRTLLISSKTGIARVLLIETASPAAETNTWDINQKV